MDFLKSILHYYLNAGSAHSSPGEGRVVVESGDACLAELARERRLAIIVLRNARFSRFLPCRPAALSHIAMRYRTRRPRIASGQHETA